MWILGYLDGSLYEVVFMCIFSSKDAWSLGMPSSELSYYDGMIELNYQNGTVYNNEEHIQRSTHITFLCDRDAGVGQPEYQVRTKCN